jgi:hypothetical protein
MKDSRENRPPAPTHDTPMADPTIESDRDELGGDALDGVAGGGTYPDGDQVRPPSEPGITSY